MAKLVHFLKSKLKEKDGHVPQQTAAVPKIDIYQSYLTHKWDDVLNFPVSEEDVVTATKSALERDDVEGALKMMSVVTSFTTTPIEYLEWSWVRAVSVAITSPSYDWNIVDSYGYVEHSRRGKDKTFQNLFMNTLCNFSSDSPSDCDWQKRRDGTKRLASYCRQQGYLSFGFDLAVSSGNYDEACSILESAGEKSDELAWTLEDIACHVTPAARSLSFIDHCTQKGEAALVFSLAIRLKEWDRVKERIEAGSEAVSSLRFALGRAVLSEEWEVVRLLLNHLPVREVREELANCVPGRNAGVVINLLLEGGQVPEAVRLAASHGLLSRAAEIIASEQLLMDHELSVHVTNACFDNCCAPDQFLAGCCLDRDVMKHILDSSRRKPLSDNQWEVVWKLINTCLCPAEVVAALAKRAVQEDASCLSRFVGRGIDDELMDFLLQEDHCDGLSDRQLQCVADLLRKEAQADCEVTEDEKKEADEVQTKQPGDGHKETPQRATDEGQDLDQGQGCSLPESDWSTTIPVIDGVPVNAWHDVMKAAQMAKHSKRIRQLTIKAAREGMWNCFICLAIDGLHEHPLDILIKLLHEHPEKLVLSYLKEPEQWLCCEEESCHQGWTDGLPHEADILNLYTRGLVEERHRAVLLKRALVRKDWNGLHSLVLLDLTLAERRAIFSTAMQEGKWSLAMDVFDGLPDNDRVDPQVFERALLMLKPSSSELISLMIDRGLYNPYLTPQFFPNAASTQGVQPQTGKKTGAFRRKDPYKKSWFFKTPASPATARPVIGEFWIHNPPVTEANKAEVTSKAGKRVAKAAAAGDWVYVMNSYEGGMGGASKDKVLQEAMRQDKWSLVTALIRRDPEAELFYGHSREMENAIGVGAWSAVEAVVDKLATKEGRDWLLPRAVDVHRWSLVLKLVKKGVDPELCEQAVLTAIAENEWSFVLDFVQMKEVSCPGSLGDRVKKEIVKMVVRLLAFVRTPDQGEGQNGGKDGCLDVDEDDSGIMQMTARMSLWKVCQALLLCGVSPKIPMIPSILYFAVRAALRHGQADVIHALLRLQTAPVTKEEASRILRDLLLIPDLINLDPQSGVELVRELLHLGADPFIFAFRRASRALRYRQTGPAQQSDAGSNEGEDPTANVDADEFTDWISCVLRQADASSFQPCVARVLKVAVRKDDCLPGMGLCEVASFPNTICRCPCTCQFQPSVEPCRGPDRVPLRVDRARKQCPDVEILDVAWPDLHPTGDSETEIFRPS